MPGRTIDPRYVPTSITVPINTAIASPTSTDPGLGHVLVDQVELFVPPGHQGLTGLAVQLAGTHVVPFGAATDYIVTDDADLTFELGVETDTGLRVMCYNIDPAFPHTFYLRWKVRSLARSTSSTSAPAGVILPIGTLGG